MTKIWETVKAWAMAAWEKMKGWKTYAVAMATIAGSVWEWARQEGLDLTPLIPHNRGAQIMTLLGILFLVLRAISPGHK